LSAQSNVARDGAIIDIRFPLRLLTLVCLLAITAFVWFSWIIFEHLRADRRIDLLSIAGALAVGGTSLIAWFSAAHGVRRWRAELLDSFHRCTEAEENLHNTQRKLEVRVKKRTAELANANESLHAENAERKRGEEALLAGEERYRRLFESNPSPMWVYDLETLSFLAVNDAAVRHYGYSQDEFLEMTMKDIRPSEDISDLTDDLSEEIGTDGLENLTQWRHRTENGALIDVEVTSHELTWLGRRAKLVLINDITERKRAEGRLRQQARLLDLAHDAIMVRDMEDRVEFWNHGAEELYGWTAAETQGRKASSFLYQDEPAATAAARAAVLDNGKWAGECRHNRKDGGTITVRSGWTLVRDELAAPKSILIINTDVTEQKNLETHLLRAQRLESMGTLASGVAHDLNNILTPILMCAEVLKGAPLQEDLPALISMIEESARRGANVVKQVLTFAGGIEGERVVIKPSHLIQEMIDIAQQTFPKMIEIIGRYPDDLWSIEGDPTQLHQVLLNLSVNARDAMPNGGSLTFGAENFNVDENHASMMPGAKAGPHVMLRVSDTGGGMPRALVDKIFDPFFTTKEVGKGTGLGLSTTLGIVKGHSGFISVYSEPGKGSTFKVFLPAAAIQEELAQSTTSIVPVQGNGELILVVDDEPNILGITKMILKKHKYNVVSANDGPEALAIFAQQMKSIRVVLTDLSMPYMDGVALVRSLKKMRSDLSIVASTGQGEQAGLAELLSLGVKNFLTKPYDVPKLLRTVHDALAECV
jgi:PAS domain S-box-containing protein